MRARPLGPCDLAPRGDPYRYLVRSVLYQPLAGSAARAIEARLHARFGGRVLDARRLAPLDDDAVVEPVTVVRGVDPWTAHRLLMFSLGRPDVLPAGDSTACAMAR